MKKKEMWLLTLVQRLQVIGPFRDCISLYHICCYPVHYAFEVHVFLLYSCNPFDRSMQRSGINCAGYFNSRILDFDSRLVYGWHSLKRAL